MTLAGWGGLAVAGRERLGEDLAALTEGAVLTRGLGRSYGDAGLPPAGVGEIAGSRLADRILSFDRERGLLRAEAGLSLRELHRVVVPAGWFAPVSPGTEEVTLGGMVAADVHGKNHHRAGSIGAHLSELRLRLADGRVVGCSRREEPELFRATVGGMGLTGHLLEVELALERIPSPWVRCETRRFARLEPLVEALGTASSRWPFTAAWLDGLARGSRLGRGVLLCGRWCQPEEAPEAPPPPRRARDVPFFAPDWLLNRLSVGLFNRLYYLAQRPGQRVVHPAAFFYPLDQVGRWSRLYGRRGMTQHQCVLPGAGPGDLRRFLELVHDAGGAPFLAVLKDFGAAGEGLLSFPRPGLTLCLDFAVSGQTPSLIATLNRAVREAGGRIYLAKDAFTTGAELAAMEGERLALFRAACRRWDPAGRIRSRLAERLALIGPVEADQGAGTARAAPTTAGLGRGAAPSPPTPGELPPAGGAALAEQPDPVASGERRR